MGRWVRIDRRYNQPYRLTGYAHRAILKWVGLVLAWLVVNSALTASHLGLLDLATTGGLIWYAVHCARRNQKPQLGRPVYTSVMPTGAPWQSTSVPWLTTPPSSQSTFNPPPGWPTPPPGWSPEPGWQADPSWPPPPPGWQFWSTAPRGAPGERNSRVIPQDVKIAVSVRDQGKCVECGTTEDLHYDHKIPWARGGTNSVSNIQLMCGPCNRRKGVRDDFASW